MREEVLDNVADPVGEHAEGRGTTVGEETGEVHRDGVRGSVTEGVASQRTLSVGVTLRKNCIKPESCAMMGGERAKSSFVRLSESSYDTD